MKWRTDSTPSSSNIEHSLLHSSESLNEKFLLLIQAVSGVRAFTSQVTEDLSEIELLDQLLFSMIENLDLERCSIFLLEDGELKCAVGKDWDEYINRTETDPDRESHSFLLGQGIMGIAAENGAIYHCKNCRLDKNFLPIINKGKDMNYGSLIATPIMVGEECLGVLNISHPEPDFFHLWQEHILAIHANILGRTLKRFRLMNAMQKEVNKRTSQLQIALNESERLKQQFETLSFIDDLTQLYNRRFLFTHCPTLLSKAVKSGQQFSLLLLDADNFKSINDTFSHDTGDKVLRGLANLLKGVSRGGDIVSRIGGEEFAYILPNTDLQAAKILAERIRVSVSKLVVDENIPELTVTVSIGIAVAAEIERSPTQTFSMLLRDADKALYACKDAGRNRCLAYEDIQTH